MTKEKILLLTLAVIQFSHITYFMILMPLGPQLMDSFNILPSQFALLVSTYTFSAGTSGFVGAFFIDRFDRKKAILTMAAGFALGTLAQRSLNAFSFVKTNLASNTSTLVPFVCGSQSSAYTINLIFVLKINMNILFLQDYY